MTTADMFDETQFDKFMKYHADNSHVYKLFEKYAFQAINSGRKHYSHWVIIGLIRWDYEVTTNAGDFKINNNHIAYYARLFMDAHPQHEGFFNIKKMKNYGS